MNAGGMAAAAVIEIIYGLVLVTMCAAAVAGLLFLPLYRLVSGRLADSTPAFNRRLADVVQRASTLQQPFPPSVFLKPIGDEAAMALVWTSAMAALGQGTSSLLFRLLQWTRDRWMSLPWAIRLVLAVFLTTAWSMGTALLIVTSGDRDPLASAWEMTGNFEVRLSSVFKLAVICAVITWATMLLIVSMLIAALLVTWVVMLGVGTPSLTSALYCRINVEAIPTGRHQLVLVNVSAGRNESSGFTHSALYGNPGAIQAVLHAIEGFEAQRSAGRST